MDNGKNQQVGFSWENALLNWLEESDNDVVNTTWMSDKYSDIDFMRKTHILYMLCTHKFWILPNQINTIYNCIPSTKNCNVHIYRLI